MKKYFNIVMAAGMSLLLLLSAGCQLDLSAGTGGKIVSSSGNYDCESECSFDLSADGINETFTAVPDPGFAFTGWAGMCKAESGTCVVNINQTFAAETGTAALSADFSLVSVAPPPVAASLSLSLDIKTFRFTWDDVSSATYYRLLEDPTGQGTYSQVSGDISRGVKRFDHYVPLYARVNAQYILQSCNSEGCIDSAPYQIFPDLAEAVGYFKAGNTDAEDAFGSAVSISADGSILAVGAPDEDGGSTTINGAQDDNSEDGAGAVYVFTRVGNVWLQQAYLKASNAEAGDAFGSTLSLSADGSRLAVGAVYEDSASTGVNGDQYADETTFEYNSGACYVFVFQNGNWVQEAYIKPSNTGVGKQFAYSVALDEDGDVLAVSQLADSSGSTGINGDDQGIAKAGSGAVFLFTRNDALWSQQAYIKASNSEGNDKFGKSVALSADGNTLAVGAIGEDSAARGINGNQDDNNSTFAGAAYVFRYSNQAWFQQAYIKASNTYMLSTFGWSIALSADGNTLAVGSRQEASNAMGINGNQNNTDGDYSGAVYVFTFSLGSWYQQAYIKADRVAGFFGGRVSLSADGNRLAVGAASTGGIARGVNGNVYYLAPPDSDSTGIAYMFSRSGSVWQQLATLNASNTDSKDLFGTGLALSADGDTLAVGAPNEDSAATGIGGNQADNSYSAAGAVYLF